ncbi:MAG: hypothetical protein M1838_003265 [Thelocarpon superellum]|nr:MAG: hypothetical protein M1838_003265 [Thelocarpon superellum]
MRALPRTPHAVLFLPFLLPTSLALSLSNFQPINSSNQGCLAAYNADIPACSTSDFTNGAPCSSACVASLGSVQKTVSQACQGVQGPTNSLLGDLLNGAMIVALCPNVQTTVTLVGTHTVSDSAPSTATPAPAAPTTTFATSPSPTSSANPALSPITVPTSSTSGSSPSSSSLGPNQSPIVSSLLPTDVGGSSPSSTTGTDFGTTSFSFATSFQSTDVSTLPTAAPTAQQPGGGGSPFGTQTTSGANQPSPWGLLTQATSLGLLILAIGCL